MAVRLNEGSDPCKEGLMNQRTQALPALMLDDPPVVGAYLDACPECDARDNEPASKIRRSGWGIFCTYACHHCRSTWVCSWAPEEGDE